MLPNHGERLQRDDHEYRDFLEEHYQLGDPEPRHGMLCFDRGEGVVKPDEVILLRLDEDDMPYTFDWGEAIAIYVVLQRDDLASRDFGRARMAVDFF